MEKASVILIAVDRKGFIVEANSYARSITGLDLKGKNFNEVLVDFSGSFNAESFFCTEEKTYMYNIITASGLPETYYFRFREDGDLVLVIGELDYKEIYSLRKNMISLNNELGNLTRALHKSNAELENLNSVKNRLLGMAAHDLRSPLAIIEAYSSLLMEELAGTLNSEHEEFLDIIQSTSSFMRGLIDNTLDISVIESGEMELSWKVCNSVELIEKNIQLNRVLADRKNIKIGFTVSGDIPSVALDENKILQVMNNLISNAVKFSPSGSEVSVLLEADEEAVTVSVRDQGPGIPEHEHDNLFKPFGRTSVRATGEEKCTGLGLAIVKNIIEAHKGEVSFKSSPGEGSVFTFKIPLKIT
jgi:signal transduction histidine kinase